MKSFEFMIVDVYVFWATLFGRCRVYMLHHLLADVTLLVVCEWNDED